jgi:hypothetical protein
MNTTFENIRYKKTTCVIFTEDELSQSPIRKVKINHDLWTRKRPVKGKRCCFRTMNLNSYVLKQPSEKNQFKNEIASRIMGFIILGPAIVFSTNGFHLSMDHVDELINGEDDSKITSSAPAPTNAFGALSCSDDDDDN